MSAPTYRQVVKAYRDAFARIDLRSDETAQWAGFYREAQDWCEAVSQEHGVHSDTVTGIVALTSPRMPWGRNKQVALRITAAFAQSYADPRLSSVEGVVGILDEIHNLGITRERRNAVARFLVHGDWNVKALKVTAFRDNLRGDYSATTIDTWMAKPFGLDKLTPAQYAILSRAVKSVAAQYYTSPAVVQAILWGYFRQGSGWARHDNFTAITLEV